MKLELLSLQGVSVLCQQQMARFVSHLNYDAAYCLELFRRALAQPHSAAAKEAWQTLYQRYFSQVVVWVKRHPKFGQTGLAADTLADSALSDMWLAFANQPDKLSHFPLTDSDKCLRTLLAYLKACVHSTVENHTQPYVADLPEELVAERGEGINGELFWRCIDRRLANEKERVVIDACFVFGLKPRQVFEGYPGFFQNIQEIYRIKENVLARLERDASLRHCLEEAIGE